MAQLKWEKSALDFTPSVNDTNVLAHFKFKNEGAYDVVIGDLQTSCGCTTANLDKKIYRPGESGEVLANFTIGNHHGKESKSIAVQTNDRKSPVYVLTMNITIPEPITVEPNTISWDFDEKLVPKTYRITFAKDFHFKSIRFHPLAENLDFNFELKTVKEGQEYAVEVTPKLQKMTSAAKTIVINMGEPNEKMYNLIAYIQHAKKK